MIFRLELSKLRVGIRSELLREGEEDKPAYRWVPGTKLTRGRYEIEDEPEEKVKKAPPDERMSYEQRFERDLEAWIEHMSSMPEYETLNSFVGTKIDDDDFSFDFKELNSLARSLWRGMVGEDDVLPPSDFVVNLRDELTKAGLAFVGRTALRLPRSGKNAHGTHPFAGAGGGGSGFGNDGSVGGRGPGNIGGKRAWEPDKRDLPMGAGKERRLRRESILREATCPGCGDPDAYVGLNDVECPNKRCSFFSAKQAKGQASVARKAVSPSWLARNDWKAYEAFSQHGDLEEMMESSDLNLYSYDGEYYTESHDERTLYVFRDGKLVELDWKDRPL